MKRILKRLGFVPMPQFIEEQLNLKIDGDGIFIKCKHNFPELPIRKSMSSSDILAYALEVCSERNQLCNGYCKVTKKWYSTNTSRNLLKSKRWEGIFDMLGCEYSVFILTKCSIIEEVSQRLVFVCGDFGEHIEKKQNEITVNRERLFHGRGELARISLETAFKDILVPDAWNNETIIGRLFKAFNRFNQMPLKSLFKSFFSRYSSVNDLSTSQDDSIINHQIDPENIADFLFMVSKKFLRPVFNQRDFRVLKGKIVLLLKRNILETVNKEELTKHMKISSLKLFREAGELGLVSKSCILSNLLLFIFDRVYLNILSFFFYSTTSSFSKSKVLYFTRAEWDRSASRFISNYLKRFTKVGRANQFATLRCIPKESGFRVVFNCSKLSSYYSKAMGQGIKEGKGNDLYGSHFAQSSPFLSVEIIRQRYKEVDSILQDDPGAVHSLVSSFRQASSKTGSILQNDRTTGHELSTRSGSGINGMRVDGNSAFGKEAVELCKSKGIASINSTVAAILPILKKESLENMGYSLLDHRNVEARLFSFLRSANQRLYMMKVDLDKCFDNIPQKDLVSILNSLFKKEIYCFQEFVVLKESDIDNKMKIKYVRSTPDVLYPINMIEKYMGDLGADHDMNTIIKENRNKILCKSEILNRIDNIVEKTAIYHQNAYYRPTTGIPQGCSISPVLCAVYYGHLDKEFKHLNGFISRFVDDFLVITPHINAIKEFFTIAHSLRDKGFIINKAKISANFNVDVMLGDPKQINCEAPQKDMIDGAHTTDCIEWCGMKIYDRDVGLKSVLKDKYFRYSVHVSGPNAGKRIFLKIQRLMEIRCSSVYINKLNSKSGENMFDAFYFVGRKLKIMILRLDFVNASFVKAILDWCVERVKYIVKRRRVLFDDWKIESMARKAFEKCGVCHIRKRSFNNT